MFAVVVGAVPARAGVDAFRSAFALPVCVPAVLCVLYPASFWSVLIKKKSYIYSMMMINAIDINPSFHFSSILLLAKGSLLEPNARYKSKVCAGLGV